MHSLTFTPLLPTCIPQKYGIKRKQSSNCSGFNSWHRVHGQNHANTHLFRVSGTETGRGKQWLNVFVTEPQKLIAGYLHSQDHTQSSLLNGETHIVIKGHCYKRHRLCVVESRRYCSRPLSI